MQDWPRKLSALLATSLLVPIIGELAIAIVKNEKFNLVRALAFVAIIGGCALALLFGRVRRMPLRLTMALFLTVCGVALSAFGFVLTLRPDTLTNDTVADVSGMIVLCVGLFIMSAGLLLLSDHRTRFAEELAGDEAATPAMAQPRYVLRKFGPYRPNTDGIVDLCKQAVGPDCLHYVAYYIRNECAFRLDVFEEPSVARFHGLVSPDERRAAYERYGVELHAMLNRLNTDFHEIDSGALVRLVLDVERGAIYYLVVHSETGRHLVGVTLNQDMVHVADTKLQRLVDEIRHYLGHPRLPDLVS